MIDCAQLYAYLVLCVMQQRLEKTVLNKGREHVILCQSIANKMRAISGHTLEKKMQLTSKGL